ncbi:MAG TPA: FAD-dependent oxidoreductase [Chloroflexaceae bacterium]|nr:FAD-dependent oxidoreductase [Chloroflexaceae bacterium]
MSATPQLVVVGAGLAGLAAARRLRAAGARVTVLEREPVVGGRARTAEVEGCRLELGAEFLASFYSRTLALVRELGLAGDLRRIPRSAATLRDGRLHPLWPSPRVAFTHLVGSRQKLALSYLVGSLLRHSPELDLHAFERAHAVDDASISDYARAHLSEELLEYVLQPPLSGIFYWTPERTSRALLLLVLRAGLSRLTGMQLFTLREGLGQLPRALAAGLDVRLAAEAVAITPRPGGGYAVRARITGDELRLEADGVVMATTATAVPRLLPWLDPGRRAFFEAIAYSSTVNLAVGTRGRLPRGVYGLLFPRRETPFLASATVQTIKDPGFAPRGRDAICLHLSGPAAAALREHDDATLARLMLADLRRLAPRYDPVPQMLFQRLYRCPEALPLFDVGHFRRLAAFAQGAIEAGPLVFAGDYLGGPFVEGAVVSGEAAAERLRARLGL